MFFLINWVAGSSCHTYFINYLWLHTILVMVSTSLPLIWWLWGVSRFIDSVLLDLFAASPGSEIQTLTSLTLCFVPSWKGKMAATAEIEEMIAYNVQILLNSFLHCIKAIIQALLCWGPMDTLSSCVYLSIKSMMS